MRGPSFCSDSPRGEHIIGRPRRYSTSIRRCWGVVAVCDIEKIERPVVPWEDEFPSVI